MSYFIFLNVADIKNIVDFEKLIADELPNGTIFAISDKSNATVFQDTSIKFIERTPNITWENIVNDLAVEVFKTSPNAQLFLWDSSIIPAPGTLKALSSRLSTNKYAAVNPIIVRPGFMPDTQKRILNMGIAADTFGFLHAIYEGKIDSDPLAQKLRTFQVGTTKAICLRLADFIQVKGLATHLDSSLAEFDFCLRLKNKYQKNVICVDPTARATSHNYFANLELLGLWNSYQQRGRLQPGLVEPDYHLHLQSDGFEYHADFWLNQGPNFDFDPTALLSQEDAWFYFCQAPSAQTLAKYLTLCSAAEAQALKTFCQSYPYYLPRTSAWYTAKAKALLKEAQALKLTNLEADLVAWLSRQDLFRAALKQGMRDLHKIGFYGQSLEQVAASYDFWQEIVEPNLGPCVSKVEVGASWPQIAVIMPIYNPDLNYLQEAIDSIYKQSYPNWQLCLADDASTDKDVITYLESITNDREHIRLTLRPENGHISLATNSALALVDAPYTCLMDQDDLLAKNAFEETLRLIVAKPILEYVYTDEDHIDADKVRRTPFFKPFITLEQLGYHLSTYRTNLLRKIGGLRQGVEGAQDLDLSLRVALELSSQQIGHIPRVLYHWRIHAKSTAGSVQAKPYVIEAQKRVLLDWAKRLNLDASLSARQNRCFTFRFKPRANLTLSVVFLADSPSIHPTLIKSITQLEPYLREVFWVPFASMQKAPRMLAAFCKGHLPQAKFTAWPFAPISWQAACNRVAEEAKSDILLFVATSLVPCKYCYLEELLGLFDYQVVALSIACLWQNDLAFDLGLFPDAANLPFALGRGFAEEDLKHMYAKQFFFNHRCLGSSGNYVCFAVPRISFLEASGLDENMGSFSISDYVLKNEEKGLTCIASPWVNFAISAQNDFWQSKTIQEKFFYGKWKDVLQNHQLRNPLMKRAEDNMWKFLEC